MGILNFGNKKKEKSSAMIATLPVTNQSTSATEEVEATQPTPDATKEKKPLTVSYGSNNIVVFLTIQYYCLPLRHE